MYKLFSALLFLLPVTYITLSFLDSSIRAKVMLPGFFAIATLYLLFAFYFVAETFFVVKSHKFFGNLWSKVIGNKISKKKVADLLNAINNLVSFVLVGVGMGVVTIASAALFSWVLRDGFGYELVLKSDIISTNTNMKYIELDLERLATRDFLQLNEANYGDTLGSYVAYFQYMGYDRTLTGYQFKYRILLCDDRDSSCYWLKTSSSRDSDVSFVKFSFPAEKIQSFEMDTLDVEMFSKPILIFRITTDRRNVEIIARTTYADSGDYISLPSYVLDSASSQGEDLSLIETGDDYVVFEDQLVDVSGDGNFPARQIRLELGEGNEVVETVF